MPPQRLKRSITASEFIMLKQMLEDEPNEFNALYYYLAAISTEIAKGNAKNPKSIKIKDKILKFTKVSAEPSRSQNTDHAAKMNRSKTSWLQALGLKRGK
jgi:hypothetical protein